MKKITLLFLLFQVVNAEEALSGNLFGQITCSRTGKPIVTAAINILPLDTLIYTDSAGCFRITSIPTGRYSISATGTGYFSFKTENIIISSVVPEELAIELNPIISNDSSQILQLSDLKVNAKKSQIVSPGHSTTGTYNIQRDNLLRAPGTLQDITYYIQNLPGVIRTNDRKTELVVRGGDPSENTYLIDGIPVFNINHFEKNDFSDGGIGNINPYFIDKVVFHNGAFAARFPDKLSSTMEINFKKGNSEIHSGRFLFDAAGTGGLIEGPVPGTGGSITSGLTIRWSSLAFLDTLGLIDFDGVPRYRNLHWKVNSSFGKFKLSMNILGAQDDIEETKSSFSSREDSTGVVWDRELPKITTQKSENLFGSLRLSRAGNSHKSNFYAAANYRNLEFGTDKHQFWKNTESGITDSLKEYFDSESGGTKILYGADMEHFITDAWTMRYGVLHEYYMTEYKDISVINIRTRNLLDTLIENQNSNELNTDYYNMAGYLEAIYQSSIFDLYFGFRQLYDEWVNATMGGPRIGSKVYLGKHAFKYAAGMHTQSPVAKYIRNGIPMDNGKLPYSIQNVIGWESVLFKDLFISVEIFDKENFNMLRKDIDEENITEWNSHKMVSRGSELYMKKPFYNVYWTSLSYSYFWNREHRDGSGKKYEYSLPHVFSAMFGMNLKKKFELSMKVNLASASPYTKSELDSETRKWVRGERFAASTFPSGRMDFKASYHTNFKYASLRVFIEILNVTDTKNYYVKNESTILNGWGFFPLAGIDMSF